MNRAQKTVALWAKSERTTLLSPLLPRLKLPRTHRLFLTSLSSQILSHISRFNYQLTTISPCKVASQNLKETICLASSLRQACFHQVVRRAVSLVDRQASVVGDLLRPEVFRAHLGMLLLSLRQLNTPSLEKALCKCSNSKWPASQTGWRSSSSRPARCSKTSKR